MVVVEHTVEHDETEHVVSSGRGRHGSFRVRMWDRKGPVSKSGLFIVFCIFWEMDIIRIYLLHKLENHANYLNVLWNYNFLVLFR